MKSGQKSKTYHWIPQDTLASIIVDTDITLAELEEKLRLKSKVDRNKIVLKLSYACDSWDLSNQPIFLEDNEGVAAYMMDCDEKGHRAILWVEIIELVESEKDDQTSEIFPFCNNLEGGAHATRDNHEYKIHDTATERGTIHDKFFNCVVIGNDIVDAPSVHIVNEVNVNEIPTVSHDNLEEPSSPCNQALDMLVINDWDPIDQLYPTNDEAPSLYIYSDGSNFEISQNFVSKEELKSKLYEAAINNYWKIKIVKSDKSLYVVKCVDDDCQWHRRRMVLSYVDL